MARHHVCMRMHALRDRVLTPEGNGHRFVDACFAMSSGTRLAVLQTLMASGVPLHIRELARRIGLDPSPVRSHLEVLVKTGYARELDEVGRERRFIADVSAIRLVLAPPERPLDIPQDIEPTRPIEKMTARMEALQAKITRMEREIADLAEARADMWRRAMR